VLGSKDVKQFDRALLPPWKLKQRYWEISINYISQNLHQKKNTPKICLKDWKNIEA